VFYDFYHHIKIEMYLGIPLSIRQRTQPTITIVLLPSHVWL